MAADDGNNVPFLRPPWEDARNMQIACSFGHRSKSRFLRDRLLTPLGLEPDDNDPVGHVPRRRLHKRC